MNSINIKEYYKNIGQTINEGHSQSNQMQTEFLTNIIKSLNENKKYNDDLLVMEIGFNGGHSAETILNSSENVKLRSFDIGTHYYVNLGKKYIDYKFPNRHELTLGDSTESLPNFFKKNKNIKYDLIFIDGGHTFNVAMSDIINSKNFAHKNTIVIMDDVVHDEYLIRKHNEGPNKAWKQAIDYKLIKELGHIDYSSGRGNSWGKFKNIK